MLGQRSLWRLFTSLFLVVSTSIAAVSWLASVSFRKAALASVEKDLATEARLFGTEAEGAFTAENTEPYDRLSKSAGARTDTRFTLVLPSGRVIGDSVSDPRAVPSLAERPEIRAALAGEPSVAIRFDAELSKRFVHVAVPVDERGVIVGVIRASTLMDELERSVGLFTRRVALAGMALAGIGAALSFVVARHFSRPLEEILANAEAMARGDAPPKLPVTNSVEHGGLAEALNRIAALLDERSHDAVRGLKELDAISSSTIEGILVVDVKGQILRVNRAVTTLLDAREADLVGKSYSDAIAHPGLSSFVRRTLASAEILEEDLLFGSHEPRYIEARGTPVKDSFSRTTGAVFALDDRTELRNLSTLRRDFAAHVSHELKTPLTAIKGFADTLLRGALREPRDAEHFVKVIAEQTDRLHEIVESLMDLARIEGQAESGNLQKSWHRLGDILRTAVSELNRGDFPVHIDCPAELTVRVNAALVERAIGNLVDNAMRYAGAGCSAWVAAREEADEVVIRVRDDGEGIEKAHRERIFERFYRISRDRGRYPEGSGLGLAIVKHVVLAHGGTISVESLPGKGATFILRIPRY